MFLTKKQHEQFFKKKKKKVRFPEHTIQKEFFKYLDQYRPHVRPLCFSIPNEGARSLIQGSLLKQRGLTKGVPDVFCAVNTDSIKGLFIEFKAGNNSLTEHQSKMIELLRTKGYRCVVCYSAGEAISELEEIVGSA